MLFASGKYHHFGFFGTWRVAFPAANTSPNLFNFACRLKGWVSFITQKLEGGVTMARGVFPSLGLAAILGLLLFADSATAQGRWWGGARPGGWYGPYGGYYSSYFGPRSYNYGWGYPYGYSWAYPYTYSGGYWPGYYGYYGGWPYYASTGYGAWPWYGGIYSYYGTNYAPRFSYGVIGSSTYYGHAPAELAADSASSYGATASASDSTALINVKVPPDADVWFDNFKTRQTGQDRRFITPSIDPDHNFSYEVRARWTEGNRQVEQTRKVTAHAGKQSTVDFISGPGRTTEQVTPRPLD
jgi:uncharacterized protein (TIGR03000 family)